MTLATKGGAEPLGQPDGVYSAAVPTSASARRRLPMALGVKKNHDNPSPAQMDILDHRFAYCVSHCHGHFISVAVLGFNWRAEQR